MSSIAGLRVNCEQMLESCESDLNKEEQYDTNSRAAHGAQWTIMASTGLN